MATNITIVAEKEAPLIAELSRETFSETYASYNTKENMELFMSGEFAYDKLIHEVGTPGTTFFLARYNNAPAGYAYLREGRQPGFEKNEALEIVRIYVKANFKRQGIGKELIANCIRLAREKKIKFLWLAVWQKNKAAIDFYKSQGFHKFGKQVFMLGKDAQKDWQMKMDLP